MMAWRRDESCFELASDHGWKRSLIMGREERRLWGEKETYGRSPMRSTVGRHHDLQWVFSTTYRRSFFDPFGEPVSKG